MSNQNQRKIGTGESIAFAGKYKDESCTEGGRDILQSMTDTIKYTGLEAGKTYTIKGWLADAETGVAVKDASGNGITIKPDTASQAAASGGSGTWDVVYEFDGTGLEGRKLVSFIEEIYDGDTKKFEFKDKNDKKETFFIPEVKTKLIDLDTNEHVTAEGESTLVDTISYNNLLPNTEYKVVSKLIDTETGEVGIDSNKKMMECESSQKTGNADSGEWEIKLEFDIDKGGAGKTYVAYEEIYIEKEKPGSGEWILIAEHKDITDQNQMTTVPLLTTIALNQKTDTHLSYAEKYVNIYDIIHYENLIPNKEYIVASQLIDADTQAIITDDNGVEQSIETKLFTDVDHDAGRYGSYGDIVPENHDGNGGNFFVEC